MIWSKYNMKQIFLATNNKGKINTIQKALTGYDIKLKCVSLDLPEPRTDDLKEIAKSKVIFAFNQIKNPCIAIDSGFYIHSLNGFPRAFVHFVLNTIGIKGILKLVDGQNRECEFQDCLAYFDDSLDEPIFFESTVKGILIKIPREQKRSFWGKLHTIFVPEGYSKTISEMNDDEYKSYEDNKDKNNFAKKFVEWFSQR